MCASYGLGGGKALPKGLGPMSERGDSTLLVEWARQYEGHARITGRIAKNLNPLILGRDRALEFGWWSLPRPSGEGTEFNSRDSSLLRYWREPFQQRALLPASWYDEGRKRWGLAGGRVFAIAAITATVEHDGAEYLGYSMVTRPGVGEAASVVSKRGDSRMPLVLPASMWGEWLDPERRGDRQLVDDAVLASDLISRAMTTGTARAPRSDMDEAPTLF